MTRGDFELIAGILAKHKASEEMVQAFSAELAGTNPRFDRQRFTDASLPLKRTVYVASAWWEDNDPFVTIAGNDPKKVEKAINRAMKDAATDAYNGSEPEDKRKLRDYLNDIGWSGVNTFAFDAVIPRDGDKDAIVYLSVA